MQLLKTHHKRSTTTIEVNTTTLFLLKKKKSKRKKAKQKGKPILACTFSSFGQLEQLFLDPLQT